MKNHRLAHAFVFFIVGLLALVAPHYLVFADTPRITFGRVPNGGLQPQVVVSGNTVYLVYFKGDAQAGDLFYVRSLDGGATWSNPLQVNSQSGSAIAMGSIRGATLAVGRGGRVCVAWNGSDRALPRNSAVPAALRKYGDAPLLYSRLNSAGNAFEPQRNLLTHTFNLDGGACVAADSEGRIYVAWHANDQEKQDESGRRLFLAISRDDGATFASEKPAWNQPTGACGCCQVRIVAQNGGHVELLYRAATQQIHRDTYFLQSNDGGASFKGQKIHEWNIQMCPMSSFSLTPSAKTIWAAWESRKQIYFAPLEANGNTLDPTIQPAPGEGNNRKYPVLAMDGADHMLLAWTENTAWNRGGLVKFQLYDASHKPVANGTREGVPAWSFAAVFADNAGHFTILY